MFRPRSAFLGSLLFSSLPPSPCLASNVFLRGRGSNHSSSGTRHESTHTGSGPRTSVRPDQSRREQKHSAALQSNHATTTTTTTTSTATTTTTSAGRRQRLILSIPPSPWTSRYSSQQSTPRTPRRWWGGCPQCPEDPCGASYPYGMPHRNLG